MNKTKATKKALLMSMLSMLICIAMLIGSTFAWFTDSVTSGKNRIVAGNLDVEMDYTLTPENADSWKNVQDAVNLFNPETFWEPGHTELVYLRVRNVGSLALKYQFVLRASDKVIGQNAKGEDIDLEKILKYGVVSSVDAAYPTRADARNAVETSAKTISEKYKSDEANLDAGVTSDTIALVVYMPEEVGDEANYRGDKVPSISLDVELQATQYTKEYDSFGNDYDKDAPLNFVEAADTASLKEAVENADDDGVTIMLTGESYESVGELSVNHDTVITGTADNMPELNAAEIVINDDSALTLNSVELTGASYIAETNASSITVTNCKMVDVEPPVDDVKTYNKSRNSVIALSSYEGSEVKLDIRDNVFELKNSNYLNLQDYPAAIIGWDRIMDGSVISGNTFGSPENPWGFVVFKPMNFNEGAKVEISNNTVYGGYGTKTYFVDPCPNTSRANTYTIIYDGNRVFNTGSSGAVVTDVDVQGTPGNGQILVLENNLHGDNKVTLDDIERKANSYNYVGVDVTLDENGKITGGSFVVRDLELLNEALADGYTANAVPDKFSSGSQVYEVTAD